ncbi:MAG: hypothetical protein ACRDB0_06125 [Paraclostridium sp.]
MSKVNKVKKKEEPDIMFGSLLCEIYDICSGHQCKTIKCEDCPMYIDKDKQLCDDLLKIAWTIKKKMKTIEEE